MDTQTKTATYITSPPGAAGEWRLYRLDPPLVDYDDTSVEHVIVSAVAALGGPETYISPADEAGKIISWSEMEGSFQGGLDHEQALRNAGYTVVP